MGSKHNGFSHTQFTFQSQSQSRIHIKPRCSIEWLLNNALFVLKKLLALNEIQTNEIKIKTTQDLKCWQNLQM
jgi:hypothetical protein